MQKIPENVMSVIKVVLPLLVVILLFVVVGKFGFGKITNVRAQISAAQTEQKVLSQKVSILTNVASVGEQFSNLAVSALPDSNPALAVVSQLKILAGTEALLLSEVKSGTPANDAAGLSAVSVSFNVIGSRVQIESFINKIDDIAPITVVDKIKINETSPGSSVGSISVKSFWAPFPTKIPPVSEAISDLTSDEEQIMQELSVLNQPVFSQIPPAQGGKTDPFTP